MTFYGENIDIPQSAYHGQGVKWDNSAVGRLHNETDGAVFIREIPHYQRTSMWGWRVVDAYFTDEDSTITYFRAYDEFGDAIVHPTIGVHWDGSPHRISGGFRYPPEFNSEYYIPVENKFHTPNSGGYTACILDTEYPTEGLAFGLLKAGKSHKALVIVFRLMMLSTNYPNDVEV
jgi:hypothetical protein